MSKKLFVISGHGAGDPGAGGGGKSEAILVRQLAARLKAWGGSNVKRSAYKRNYYADKGVSRMTLSKSKWAVIELHMDSAGATAKGAHVIVSTKAKPSDSAKKLAVSISDMLPGRSEKLVLRSDLRNPNAAALKGYDYKLVECGFISNKRDREYFLAHMDDIAKAILEAHGIKPLAKPISVKCPW